MSQFLHKMNDEDGDEKQQGTSEEKERVQEEEEDIREEMEEKDFGINEDNNE